MDDRNAQVGWTDEQWSRVRQVVSEEAHRARMAASFLPTYGPLPPSTEVVPSELVDPQTGRVDDTKTTLISEVSRSFDLTEQQVRDEELSSAILSFRRAANHVARAEDAIIFSSQHGYRLESGRPVRTLEKTSGRNEYRLRQGQSNPVLESVFRQVQVKGGEGVSEHESTFFRNHVSTPSLQEVEDTFLYQSLKATNPGGLGLLLATANDPQPASLDPEGLVAGIIGAITKLEEQGHLAPFVCVLGNEAFIAAHTPLRGSLVLPSDRIEPVLGSQIQRSSLIGGRQGVVVSLAGDPIDLAVAVEITPEFLNVNGDGRYHFRVYERFALRVKEPEAIVRLEFQ